MQHLKARGRRAAYEVTGNVVWLTRRADPILALKQSLMCLSGQIERSGRLKTDIATAIGVRRYELYKCSASRGGLARERSLAAAQSIHFDCLLKFVHAIAAAGSETRAQKREPAARLDPLARSIRDLEASLERARLLSREVLAQCQRPDWREHITAPGQPPP